MQVAAAGAGCGAAATAGCCDAAAMVVRYTWWAHAAPMLLRVLRVLGCVVCADIETGPAPNVATETLF